MSVVIVTWNGRRWLKRCLDSVLTQSYSRIEVLVVDNASTDGTQDYLVADYPQVRVVSSPTNVGFASGNNLGITAASGELILLLNSDTWLPPDAIAQLQTERRERGLDVIGPIEGDYYTGVRRAPYVTQIDPWGHPVYRPARPARQHSFYLTGVCLLFPKALYEATGGFDGRYFMYCEELDWFWRLNLAGRNFAYSERTTVFHAIGGSAAEGLSVRRFAWRNQNTLRTLLSNYGVVNLVWVLPTYFGQCLLETFVFLIAGKPGVAVTYPRAWMSVACELPAIRAKRSAAQAMRSQPDRALWPRMYPGLGKVHHLIEWWVRRTSDTSSRAQRIGSQA